MKYNNIIFKEMKTIIQTNPDIHKSLKSLLLQYIEVKKDYSMIFGNLCILHYKEFTKMFNSEIVKVAAAVELLILSFDIFDDLQDNDTKNIWSSTPNLSMNSSLAMIFIISKVISNCNFEHKLTAREIFDKYALKSINGQQLDLMNTCRDENNYLNMITQKSGSLTTLSSLLGVILAQGHVDNDVAEYSKLIGVIQQIENDINDLQTWDRKNDLLNKKFSLPIIFILKSENNTSKHIEDYYKDIIPSIDIELVENELINGGAFRYAIAVKNLYKYRAIKYLDNLSISEETKLYLKYLMN